MSISILSQEPDSMFIQNFQKYKKKNSKPNLNQEFVDSRQEVFSKKKRREEEAFGRRTFQHSLKKLPMLGYALLAIQGKVNAL